MRNYLEAISHRPPTGPSWEAVMSSLSWGSGLPAPPSQNRAADYKTSSLKSRIYFAATSVMLIRFLCSQCHHFWGVG